MRSGDVVSQPDSNSQSTWDGPGASVIYNLDYFGERFKKLQLAKNTNSSQTTSNIDPDQSLDAATASVGVASSAGIVDSGLLNLAPIDNSQTAVFSTEPEPEKWYAEEYQEVTIRYDFRDVSGQTNEITEEQQALVEQALSAWTSATGNKIQFVRDQEAVNEDIVVIGVGDLSAFGMESAEGNELGAAGVQVTDQGSTAKVIGAIWLDHAENWENNYGNGDVEGTYDFFTVFAHETGHIVGFEDLYPQIGMHLMNINYQGEKGVDAIENVFTNAIFMPFDQISENGSTGLAMRSMMTGFPQLVDTEVRDLLEYGSEVSESQNAIIAIVDRNGNILGVRVEQEVLDQFAGDPDGLAFAIDGAVSKARTAAFFSNDQAPLTSRLVQYISQTTITQREVEGNPNITDPDSTIRGPGYVSPIGLGGHFPPEVPNTPPVDLFAIEHSNRDSLIHPGADGIKGTADDVTLRGRFNIDPTYVPPGQELPPPESYGVVSGINPNGQNRGIATLPGGIPLYRDTTGDGIGDTLIGGVGVFFPGEDGYATYEQGFVQGDGNTQAARMNASKALEAELIALAVAGGSTQAARAVDDPRAKTAFAGNPVSTLDLPFGRLDLVGIQLADLGPTPGRQGVSETIALAVNILGSSSFTPSGADQQVTTGGTLYLDGTSAPEGWLVVPHDSAVDNITAADVNKIIQEAIDGASRTRAAIRLNADGKGGARAKMVFAVTDTTGEILGLYRMPDATVFSIDVAVAKARNNAYYADANDLQAIDQVKLNTNSSEVIPAGVAFTNRTFRYLSEARFPSGSDGSLAPQFSILNDPGINTNTAENLGAALPASAYTSILGRDSFYPETNFHDPGDPTVVAAGGVLSPTANQNGVVFFPGATPIFKGTQLIGGLGVSGDGVDQDDVVTFLAAQGYLPDGVTVPKADQYMVNGVRLPYQKFLRNPFG